MGWVARSVVVLVLLLGSVGPVAAAPPAPPTPPAVTPARAAPPPLATIPPSVAYAINRSIGADDDQYAITQQGETARIPRPNRPPIVFSAAGLATADPLAWTLRTTSIAGLPVDAAPLSVAGNTAQRQGDGWTEWVVNGPRGVQHGWTIAQATSDQATSAQAISDQATEPLLVIDLASSLPVVIDGDGTGVRVVVDGQPVWRYAGLLAFDATGRTLPARFISTDTGARVEVASRGAVLPVTVDPLLSEALLTASGGAASDNLGFAVAISADGGTVVAGAPGRATNTGAAYVFVRPGASWPATLNHTALLTAAGGAADDRLGYAVAISADGGTVVAGAYFRDAPGAADSGAAYVFVRPGAIWPATKNQDSLLTAAGGAASDYLGYAVAISADGGTVVAGAYNRDAPGAADSGAAYVFVRPGTSWPATKNQDSLLTAAGGAADDRLGYAVAISADGGTVVAGAYNRDAPGAADSGAAYVFVRPGAIWPATLSHTALLTATGGAANDFLGYAVAISADGGTVVAGAPSWDDPRAANAGAAYLFVRPGTSWPATKNHDSLLTASGGAANDLLGYAVAVSADGGTVVAGGYGHAAFTGAAYLFVRPAAGWPATLVDTALLQSATGTTDEQLGRSVGISGDGGTVAAGQPGRNSFSGAVAVFTAGIIVTGATTPTTTSLGGLPTAIVGQSAFIPVSVTSSSGTPSGSIEVTDGSVSCMAAVSAGGCALTFSTGGVKSLVARYLGSGSFLPSSAPAGLTVVAPPTNVVIATGGLPQAGTPILFAATSSGGPGTTYSWSFGDGTPAQAGTVLQHTYASGGSYSVTVTATNAAGSASTSITIEVVRTLFAPTSASQASTGW